MTRQSRNDISAEEVFAEFTQRRATITRLAIVLGIIAGGAVIFFYQGITSNTTAMILLAVIFAAAAYVHIRVWRCPSCNGHLGRLYLGLKEPKHCPNCGIKLVEQ